MGGGKLGKWISAIIIPLTLLVSSLSVSVFITIYVHSCTSVYEDVHVSRAACGEQNKVSDPPEAEGIRSC